MKKVLATLAAVALLGAFVLAVAALAGATPGSSQSSKANRVLFALLKGRNEVSATGEKGVGDPDGRGGFTALVADNKICFGYTVDNIAAPSAAHIHRGKPSVAGPVVVPLTTPATGDPGATSACSDIAPALAEEILKRPNHFYANVHTGDFPGGAVRGQLRHRR
jgi:CHRD domain